MNDQMQTVATGSDLQRHRRRLGMAVDIGHRLLDDAQHGALQFQRQLVGLGSDTQHHLQTRASRKAIDVMLDGFLDTVLLELRRIQQIAQQPDFLLRLLRRPLHVPDQSIGLARRLHFATQIHQIQADGDEVLARDIVQFAGNALALVLLDFSDMFTASNSRNTFSRVVTGR